MYVFSQELSPIAFHVNLSAMFTHHQKSYKKSTENVFAGYISRKSLPF